MSTEELGARVRRAKARGVPIVSVSTADPAQTIRVITDAINGDAPVVVWDVVRGVRPGNPAGTEAISQATSQMSPEETAGNCTAWFDWAATLPPKTLCFTLGADHWLDIEQPAGRSAVQALWNLRDSFKQNYRMMILLSPGMKMPTCLTNDVVPFDEPLPSRDEMTSLIKSLDERASACQTCGGTGTMRGGRCGACSGKGKSKRKLADEDALRAAADAVVGLSAFAAEQIVSMALLKDGGMDQQMLWDSKRAQIRQVRGLTADNETWSFEDIGGHGQAKKFGSLLFSGPEPPTVVVRIEEIEKTMAGAQGDLSGTSQDALQVVLNAMEDYNWSGMIAFGPPGCLHGDTPIYDPVDSSTRTVRERWRAGKSFHVWSMSPQGPIVAHAMPPRQFAAADMVTAVLDSGDEITVTTGHRFYCGNGEYASYAQRQGCGAFRLPTISARDLEAQQRGVHRSSRIVAGSRCGCRADRRLRDGRLLLVRGCDRSLAPSRVDAQQRTRLLLHSDDQAEGSCGSLSLCEPRLSKMDWHRLLGTFGQGGSLCRQPARLHVREFVKIAALSQWHRRISHRNTATQHVADEQATSHVGHMQPILGFAASPFERFQDEANIDGRFQGQERQTSTVQRTVLEHSAATCREVSVEPCQASNCSGLYGRSKGNYIANGQVVQWKPAGRHEYYDFHVPGWNNYWACGCWHHNSGKSLYSKSLASTFNVLSLGLDLNATKGSLVGESEQTVRAAIKTIYAVGGKSVFCVATCNKLDSLPPELRRRFRYGTWMFDVPDAEERESIWRINRAKYDIAEDDPPPPDEGFTGADIRNLCELSRRTRMPLADAVQFVAPLCKSNPEAIERARQTATGKFLSSSRAGLYQPPRAAARREEEPRGARAMRME